jgi:hypothetical protein
MVSLIEETDEEQLSRIRFGRSRFLKAMSVAVFGFLADKMLVAQPAYAATCGSASPCGPSPRCCCCSGTTCTCTGCRARVGECPSGGQCWFVCNSTIGRIVQCCDWWTAQGERCICSKVTGATC